MTTRQVNEELARALTHENEFSQKSEYDYTFGYFLIAFNALKKIKHFLIFSFGTKFTSFYMDLTEN